MENHISLRRIFNNINLRIKFLASFLLAVLLPAVILGAYFINRMTQITVDYSLNNFHMEVERLERSLAGVMETAKDVSDRFYIDEKLQSILIRDFKTVLEMTEALKAYTEMDYYTKIHEEISAVRMYTSNETIRENWRFMRVTPEVAVSSWYRHALRNEGRTVWSFRRDPVLEVDTLRLSRTMPVFQGLPLNVLTVDVRVDTFSKLLEKEMFHTLFILDDSLILSSRFIASGGLGGLPGVKWERFVPPAYWSFPEKNDGFVSVAEDNDYYRVIRRMGDAYFLNSFYLVSFFPLNRLKETKRSMLYMGLVLMLICLMLSAFLILAFTQFTLIKRIRFLSTEMRKIVAGNLNISLELEGEDEIGLLSRDIDKMVADLKVLIARVYEADLQKKQFELKQKNMQFKLLASQVNPHFLFNSLETIRAKALTNRVRDLNMIVKGLAKIMRRSLDIRHTLVNIDSEIDIALSYLGIQKYRFEEKLIYNIEVQDELRQVQVIAHLLQPIVENAVIHGLEPKLGPCTILIRINAEGGLLRLVIKDDGYGMEEDRLDFIRQCLLFNRRLEQESLGVGIMNVHQRVRLYYGEPYGIRIESKKNHGTEVEITLPLEESEGDDQSTDNRR